MLLRAGSTRTGVITFLDIELYNLHFKHNPNPNPNPNPTPNPNPNPKPHQGVCLLPRTTGVAAGALALTGALAARHTPPTALAGTAAALTPTLTPTLPLTRSRPYSRVL